MKTFTTSIGWQELDPAVPFAVPINTTLRLRADEFTTVMLDQDVGADQVQSVLVGQGQGELEIILQVAGTVEFITSGRVWFFQTAAAQTTERTSDEVFTSLDRPSPLSPEMLAIQRMVKQNEIAREGEREFMRRMLDASQPARAKPGANDPDALVEDTTEKAKPLRQDGTGSQSQPDKQQGDPAAKPADPAKLPPGENIDG